MSKSQLLSPLREALLRLGASFQNAPTKASFFVPNDLDPKRLDSVLDGFGKSVRFVRDWGDSWHLYRFVGKRKNYRTIKVFDRHAPGGVNPRLVIEVHPDGRLLIRESKRKVGYETTVSAVYVRCILQALNRKALEKARAKKASRRSRR